MEIAAKTTQVAGGGVIGQNGSTHQPGSMNEGETSSPSIRMAKHPTPLAYAVALTTVTAAAVGGVAEERAEGASSASDRLRRVPPDIHEALPNPSSRAVRNRPRAETLRPSLRLTVRRTSYSRLLSDAHDWFRQPTPPRAGTADSPARLPAPDR
jgi:hypothetical protein